MRSPSRGNTPRRVPCGQTPFSRLEEVVAKAAREGCLRLIIAPNTHGGPHYAPYAPRCGSSRTTGPCISVEART